MGFDRNHIPNDDDDDTKRSLRDSLIEESCIGEI